MNERSAPRPMAGSRENTGVSIVHVEGASALRIFIHLSANLPDRRANYVPPVWADEEAFHDPERNTALRDCSFIRLLAYRDGSAVGRVMGLVHHAYNRLHGERSARFHQLDAVNDPAVVRALLQAVEQWASGLGMDRVVGPFGLSDKDPQGFQVQGFEHLPVLATPTNPPHLPEILSALGYAPFFDALSYRLPIPDELPEIYFRIAQRVTDQGHFHLVPITSKRALRPWVLPVLRLVNMAYADLYGFIPMTELEMKHLADQYMVLLDPRLVKLVVDQHDEPMAFVVAMPDMSEGLQQARGRIWPFGWWHILRSMRRSRQLDLFLGAVHPSVQGRGLTCLLGVELMAEARRRGMEVMDSHLVLESNVRMRAELERLGASIYKRYRVFQRTL